MIQHTNNISRLFPLFIVICSLVTFFSCTAPIDINTDNSEPVIVINSVITDELKTQEVRISSSSPYFENQQNIPISGAVVQIQSSENDTYEFIENDSIHGLYQSKAVWGVKAGVDYHLKVSVDFDRNGALEQYEAQTSVLSFAGLDSIQLVPMDIMGYAHFALNIYGQDDPVHDYYICKILVNDTMKTSKISQYLIVDDLPFNGEYLSGVTMVHLDDVKTEDKFSDEDKKDMIFIKSGDKVTLQMNKVVKGYFDFINQCQQERRGENPLFGGPASNITTNISNGGVGYFCGYCITENSNITP